MARMASWLTDPSAVQPPKVVTVEQLEYIRRQAKGLGLPRYLLATIISRLDRDVLHLLVPRGGHCPQDPHRAVNCTVFIQYKGLSTPISQRIDVCADTLAKLRNATPEEQRTLFALANHDPNRPVR